MGVERSLSLVALKGLVDTAYLPGVNRDNILPNGQRWSQKYEFPFLGEGDSSTSPAPHPPKKIWLIKKNSKTIQT